MKLITYSDLHLEFNGPLHPAPDQSADLMILCGDIIVADDPSPLERLMADWDKPVFYVLGNHEYYGCRSLADAEDRLIEYLADALPNVRVLRNEAVEQNGVQFFGGTMWTDFDGADELAMMRASMMMNDYRRIRINPETRLSPQDTVELHAIFMTAITTWFATPWTSPRVVITHHAPTINPTTHYTNSELRPAFNSLDVEPLVHKYQPALWLYGHTHECDDHYLGATRIVSNQAGYPKRSGKLECADFNLRGKPICFDEVLPNPES